MGDLALIPEPTQEITLSEDPARIRALFAEARPEDLPAILGTLDVAKLFALPECMDAVLDGVEEVVRSQEPDLTTHKGRLAVRAAAAKVTSIKTSLDAAGRALTEGWREATKAVNTVRKRIDTRLDVLATETRQPFTDWEAAEERRKDLLAERLRQLEPRGATTSEELRAEIERIGAITIGADWDEARDDADRAKDRALTTLQERYETKLEMERLAAENARLAAEAAERDRIAALEQAERDRLAAEEKERADAEAKRVEAEKQAAEAARRAAEEKAAEEARQRVAAEERRQREEAERAEREARIAAEAEQKAREEADAAARAEQERRDREAAEAIAAAERRAQEAEARERAEREASEKAEADRVAREQRERDERLAREADELRRAEAHEAIRAHVLALIESLTPEAGAAAVADDAMAGRIPFLALHL